MICPEATTLGSVEVNTALPFASVVTFAWPMNVRPWMLAGVVDGRAGVELEGQRGAMVRASR